jgi:pimeloyl-ACP methyl ester carboxylesterase
MGYFPLRQVCVGVLMGRLINKYSYKIFKNYIYNYDTVVACGHSQGAGVSQYALCLLAENFPNLKRIHGDIFASPPTFNITGKKRFLAHSKKGAITLDRYLVDGDPIDSEALRNAKGVFYQKTITGLCPNTTYEFAAWVINILRVTGI